MAVSKEQLRAHIVPKQAVTFFLLKLLGSLKLYSSARIEVLIWDV